MANIPHSDKYTTRKSKPNKQKTSYSRYSNRPTKPKKNGSCFIATAVYGSYDSPAVLTLREFRDSYLLTNRGGQWFVKTYYRHSPALAASLSNKPISKFFVRIILSPLVWFTRLVLKFK
jgi:hypothetical protein